MARNLCGTEKESRFFQIVGDFSNPNSQQFAELFAVYADSEPNYYVDDIIEIGPQQSRFVKSHSKTTVGIYLFNKFIIEPLEVFGYINKEITSEVYGNLETQIANALQAGDIKQPQVLDFLNRSQYLLGGPLAHLINPSISQNIITLPPKAAKLREQLFRENKEALDADDPEVAAKIGEQVTKVALEELNRVNDPSVSLFNSGVIDPYNNYRTMFVMKGAVTDNTGLSPTGYKVVKSNYNDGVSKEDMPKIAESVVTSSYSSGVATQDSGYLGKKYNVVLQRVRMAPVGTDCGSKDYLNTIITKRHQYRYIMDGSKLVLLTPEVINKYLGKVCKLRTPLGCKSKDPTYCSVCMGSRLYKVGVHNIGQVFNTISGSTLNASLKRKHDTTLKYYQAKLDDFLKYVK